MARAREHNPTLASARAEITAAEGERALVDRSWYPNVTVTAGTSDMPNMSARLVAGLVLILAAAALVKYLFFR